MGAVREGRLTTDPSTMRRHPQILAKRVAPAQRPNAPHGGSGPSVATSSDSYLVDPASSHMLVSKIKPCMSKYTPQHGESANGSLNQLWFLRSYNPTWITVAIPELIHATQLRPSRGRALLLDQNRWRSSRPPLLGDSEQLCADRMP